MSAAVVRFDIRHVLARLFMGLGLALALYLAGSPVHAADMPDEEAAQTHIEDVANQFFDILKNEDLDEEARRAELKALMMDEVAISYIAKLSLGRYSRINPGLSAEQKARFEAQLEEYHQLFPDFIFDKMYDLVLSKFKDSSVEVKKVTPLRKTDIFVHTVIQRSANEPVMADWRLRTNNEGQMKIIDLKAEGVSMTITQRDDFASVMGGSGDLSKVLDYMRAQLAAAESSRQPLEAAPAETPEDGSENGEAGTGLGSTDDTDGPA